MVEVQAHVGERLVADGEIVFAHVNENAAGGVKIDQKNFVFSMRLLGVMDVGKAGEGLTPNPE
jgi:3-hydroxyacyl-[acyl-carrier-protein] dehydratase